MSPWSGSLRNIMGEFRLPFNSSTPDSIGMEYELQLLDASNLDLKDGIMSLMDRYKNTLFVKPEFIQNTVEVTSPVCSDLGELDQKMRVLLDEVNTSCNNADMLLCGAGTHPFSQKLAQITPYPRYLKLEKAEGYPSHVQITYATHLHFGMSSGDESIRVMRGLKKYLPLLVALSANSPYWHGVDTNYAAFRHYILASTRSYGIPPTFDNWEEFEQFIEVTFREKIFNSINDIHWDIRPRPHLGTLEVRVMDSQPNISDAISLAAFLYGLIVYLKNNDENDGVKHISPALHAWIEKDNRFKAAHFGLEADIFDEYTDTEISMTEYFFKTLDKLSRTCDRLGLERYISRLRDLVKQKGNAEAQRKAFAESGSFYGVVNYLVKRFEQDLVLEK